MKIFQNNNKDTGSNWCVYGVSEGRVWHTGGFICYHTNKRFLVWY